MILPLSSSFALEVCVFIGLTPLLDLFPLSEVDANAIEQLACHLVQLEFLSTNRRLNEMRRYQTSYDISLVTRFHHDRMRDLGSALMLANLQIDSSHGFFAGYR